MWLSVKQGNLTSAGLRFSVVGGKWEVWHVCKETHGCLDSVFPSLSDGAKGLTPGGQRHWASVLTLKRIHSLSYWTLELWYYDWAVVKGLHMPKKCKWRDLSHIKAMTNCTMDVWFKIGNESLYQSLLEVINQCNVITMY